MSLQRDRDEIGKGIRRLRSTNDAFDRSYAGASEALDAWDALGVLPRSAIEGARVLDWECGLGAFAASLLERGASEVVGIDSWLDPAHAATLRENLSRAAFHPLSLEAFLGSDHATGPFDLVFANTVTEHLPDLPARFRDCRRALAPDGSLFLNHDSYYQPTGAHDHGFLFYGADGQVVFQGERCWQSPDRCAHSKAHRDSIRERFPWSWDDRVESLCDPSDCDACPYYRRAQPWAHLLYQEDFQRLFPNPVFSTGRPESTLNKLTTFQLRQWLVESGFEIEAWHPVTVGNPPPAVLLDAPFAFHPVELRTSTVAVRARRRASDPYDAPGTNPLVDAPPARPYPPERPLSPDHPLLDLVDRTLAIRHVARLLAKKLLARAGWTRLRARRSSRERRTDPRG